MMNKLISKVTLIAFIYQTLLMPLAAMENCCPPPHGQHNTSSVTIYSGVLKESTTVTIDTDSTTNVQTKKVKNHKTQQQTATASTFTPWKRAMEYYRWGQYQDMAGEISTSIVVIGMMILIPVAVFYLVYQHYTGLNAFEEVASGVKSGTMEAFYYKNKHSFNPENILSLFTAVVAKDNNLLQSIWRGQIYFFTSEHIPAEQHAKIANMSHFLQSAFQDAPPKVWGVSTRFCSSDNDPLYHPASQFIHYHEVIDGASFPNDCPNDAEVHLIIPRHHAFDKKDPHFFLTAKTAFQKRMKSIANSTPDDALSVARQVLLNSKKLQGDIRDQAHKKLSKKQNSHHNHELVQMMNRNLWGVVQEAPNTVSSLLIQHCMHKGHFVGDPTLQFVEYGQSYRNNNVTGCNRENTVHTIMNRGHHDKDVAFEALSTFEVAYENDHGEHAGEPLVFSDRRMLLQFTDAPQTGVNGTAELETLHTQFLLNTNVTRFLTEVFGKYENDQCLSHKLKKDVHHALSPFYGVFDSTTNKVVSFFMNIVGANRADVDHLNVQFDDANFDPNNLKPEPRNPQVGSCYKDSRHHNNGYNLRVSMVKNDTTGDIDVSYGLKKQADPIVTPAPTPVPTPAPTPVPTDPPVHINATDMAHCLAKLKPYFDHDGFVNATGVVSGVGARSCADGSAMYPLHLDPTKQPYYLWGTNGAVTPYMDHRVGNMTEASLYYAITQLNATMMTATLPNGVSFNFASGVMGDLLDACSGRDAYPVEGYPTDSMAKIATEYGQKIVMFNWGKNRPINGSCTGKWRCTWTYTSCYKPGDDWSNCQIKSRTEISCEDSLFCRKKVGPYTPATPCDADGAICNCGTAGHAEYLNWYGKCDYTPAAFSTRFTCEELPDNTGVCTNTPSNIMQTTGFLKTSQKIKNRMLSVKDTPLVLMQILGQIKHVLNNATGAVTQEQDILLTDALQYGVNLLEAEGACLH